MLLISNATREVILVSKGHILNSIGTASRVAQFRCRHLNVSLSKLSVLFKLEITDLSILKLIHPTIKIKTKQLNRQIAISELKVKFWTGSSNGICDTSTYNHQVLCFPKS